MVAFLIVRDSTLFIEPGWSEPSKICKGPALAMDPADHAKYIAMSEIVIVTSHLGCGSMPGML